MAVTCSIQDLKNLSWCLVDIAETNRGDTAAERFPRSGEPRSKPLCLVYRAANFMLLNEIFFVIVAIAVRCFRMYPIGLTFLKMKGICRNDDRK